MNQKPAYCLVNEIVDTCTIKHARIVETEAADREVVEGDAVDTKGRRGEKLRGVAVSYGSKSGEPFRLSLVAAGRTIHVEMPASEWEDLVEWLFSNHQAPNEEWPAEVLAERNRKDEEDLERSRRRRERSMKIYPSLWWREHAPGALPNAKPLTKRERTLLREAKLDYSCHRRACAPIAANVGG